MSLTDTSSLELNKHVSGFNWWPVSANLRSVAGCLKLFNDACLILSRIPNARIVSSVCNHDNLETMMKTMENILSSLSVDGSYVPKSSEQLDPKIVNLVNVCRQMATMLDRVIPLLLNEINRIPMGDIEFFLLRPDFYALLRDGYPRNHMTDRVNATLSPPIRNSSDSDGDEDEGPLRRQ